ncbi:hypothetical protein I7I53_07586 [Histoplasma capsulatum var. duboisii H88]|uniref:Uncharacterized protein n=1 Tax=Ajellomyces capsulatus (strain H88) TaxID=544711 RepID=A0A8A1LE28_AJEC8|nr:hypothetical protein I7I53_07586 [Histoplasma capsulatum var. duboisii H88]
MTQCSPLIPKLLPSTADHEILFWHPASTPPNGQRAIHTPPVTHRCQQPPNKFSECRRKSTARKFKRV